VGGDGIERMAEQTVITMFKKFFYGDVRISTDGNINESCQKYSYHVRLASKLKLQLYRSIIMIIFCKKKLQC